jgi:regulatory protein YycI of two-component signal transduction system YycFG
MKWEIDKRIPIATVVIWMMHLASVIYFCGKISEKVANLEKDTNKHDLAIESLRLENFTIQKTLIKIEDKIDYLTSKARK